MTERRARRRYVGEPKPFTSPNRIGNLLRMSASSFARRVSAIAKYRQSDDMNLCFKSMVYAGVYSAINLAAFNGPCRQSVAALRGVCKSPQIRPGHAEALFGDRFSAVGNEGIRCVNFSWLWPCCRSRSHPAPSPSSRRAAARLMSRRPARATCSVTAAP